MPTDMPPATGSSAPTDDFAIAFTPLGPALVAWTAVGVSAVWVGDDAEGGGDAAFVTRYAARTGRGLRRIAEPPPNVARALATGEAGDVTVDLRGLSPFATAVLGEVAAIPRGQVLSYGAIARRVGRPRAVRAVGTAVGRNPVPLIIPCHRVVRSDGHIGRFAMGVDAKRKLLAGEGLADIG